MRLSDDDLVRWLAVCDLDERQDEVTVIRPGTLRRIVAEVLQLREFTARYEAALDYLEYNTGDTQHMSNAREIAAGNLAADGTKPT